MTHARFLRLVLTYLKTLHLPPFRELAHSRMNFRFLFVGFSLRSRQRGNYPFHRKINNNHRSGSEQFIHKISYAILLTIFSLRTVCRTKERTFPVQTCWQENEFFTGKPREKYYVSDILLWACVRSLAFTSRKHFKSQLYRGNACVVNLSKLCIVKLYEIF